MLSVQTKGSRLFQGEETAAIELPESRSLQQGEACGSAVLEDAEFIYFYDGCEIRKISQESKETSVIWASSHTDEIDLNGQAILAGDKIFFIESWWSMGYITEALSVINTDGTGYECIEEKEWYGGYLYFAEGILYVKEKESVWVYEVYTDGTWKKIKTLTGNVRKAVPERLQTGAVAVVNEKYLLDIRNETIYLIDRETQESYFLAENSGRMIGMDEEAVYLYRENSDQDGRTSVIYEKIRIEDGEKSILFSVEEFRNPPSAYRIADSHIMAQIAGDHIYYVEEADYKLYLVRRRLEDPSESETLGDAFFDSGIGQVGRIEYYSAEMPSKVNPDWGHVSLDLERLVVNDGFPGAADINRFLEEAQENIILLENQNFQSMEADLENIGEKMAAATEKEGGNFRMHYTYDSVLSPVFYYDGHYFSFYSEDEEYRDGQLHGSLYREGYIFDLLTGKRLGLEDVIENSEEEFQEIVAEYFETYINERSRDLFWEDAMDIVREQISMESDFYLREEGICFYLPPYAITYFAAGFQEVTIPYEEFKMRIRTNSAADNGQSIVYDNFWDFEEERNLPYADDQTFEKLKEAYEAVDFYGEFQQSDSKTNVIYIEAFQRLVQNEAAFYDKKTDQYYYLKDYKGVQLDIEEEGKYDPDRFEYYFFDADGDGYPELGILEEYPEGHSAFLYLFRYDMSAQCYSLWNTLYPPYDKFLGTRKVLEYDGVHMKIDYGYYQLDQEGEVEGKAYLYYLPINTYEQLCLVMLPSYADPALEVEVTSRMKQCGIFAREPEEWYFRVTDEQFWELEALLWDAYEAAEEEGEAVLYTYGELFEY